MARVWGRTDCVVGSTVTVSLQKTAGGDVHYSGSGTVTAGSSANEFYIETNGLQTQTESHDLIFTDCSGTPVTVTNVLVGDLLLCLGQSNAKRSVDSGSSTEATLVKNTVGDFPYLRWLMSDETSALQDRFDLNSLAPGMWQENLVTNFATNYPSALCYYTAYWHTTHLGGNVPVGVVAVPKGGSFLKDWLPPGAETDTTCGGTNQPYSAYGSSSVHWYGHITPVKKMAFKAVIFYQGEKENGDGFPDRYKCQQSILVDSWRNEFGYDVYFANTLLAGYPSSVFTPTFREAQLGILDVPYTSYADPIDIGFRGDSHPPTKLELGRRHSLNILRDVDQQAVMTKGPTFDDTVGVSIVSISGEDWARVPFKLTTSHNMELKDTENCNSGCCSGNTPFEYQVNGPSGSWREVTPANLIVDVGAVYIKITVGTGAILTGIRFMYEPFMQCALMNDFGCTGEKLPGTVFEWTGSNPPTGTIMPGDVSYGDPSACPQVTDTVHPTRQPTTPIPTRFPTPDPTPEPTLPPTPPPTVPPGTVLYKTIAIGTATNTNSPARTCVFMRNSVVDNSLFAMSTLIGGKSYHYMLDYDGEYNYQTKTNPFANSDWTESFTGVADNDPTETSFGTTAAGDSACQTRCNAFAECNGINYDTSNSLCQLMLQCRAGDGNTIKANRNTYLRTSFPGGFIADDVSPGETCTGVPLTTAVYQGGTRPMTIDECFNRCKPLQATHFVMNRDIGCECYNGCTSTINTDKDDPESTLWNTLYTIRLADIVTPAPTAKPTTSPTKKPTAFPTVSPTKKPTAFPTLSPTTDAPTGSPTTFIPTPSPTDSPITGQPTPGPTYSPTLRPTGSPTNRPTVPPTSFYDSETMTNVATSGFTALIVVGVLFMAYSFYDLYT